MAVNAGTGAVSHGRLGETSCVIYMHGFVMVNGIATLMPNPVALVMHHFDLPVFFGEQSDFFFTFFVFKA
jgi:hypothetical protein